MDDIPQKDADSMSRDAVMLLPDALSGSKDDDMGLEDACVVKKDDVA
jgi:hypothetical protein